MPRPDEPINAIVSRPNSPPIQPSLTTQVMRGTAWNIIGAIGQKGLIIASGILVARMLTPDDFAVAGLATAVIGVFGTLTAQGFAQALVQQQELHISTTQTVFWFMTALGMVICGLVMSLAPVMARFYDQPALVPVMAAMSLSLVFSMIGAVPNALLQRSMRFREINLIGIMGGVLCATLGIAVAWAGYGYWALILPSIGAMLFMAVRAFWLAGFRPVLIFDWQRLRGVSAFGFSLLGSNLVLYFADTMDSLIMGRFWLPGDFGQYYFALERSRQPFDLVAAQLNKTVFPAFSRIQDDLERLRRTFLKGTSFTCLIAYPIHVLIIGLADPVIPWLFGEQWRPAVPVFRVFAAVAFVKGLASLVSSGLLAIDRPQAGLFFNIFRVAVTLPALLYLGYNGAGSLKTAVVLTCIWSLQMPFYIGYLYRKLRLRWAESWSSMRLVVLGSMAMGVILVLSRAVAEAMGCSAAFMVMLSSLLSSLGFLWIVRHPLVELVGKMRLELLDQ